MEDCIFCRIVSGDAPSDTVYEDEQVMAFKDVNPQAPVHLLIIPKKHVPTFDDLGEEDRSLLGDLQLVIRDLAAEHDLDQGYRIILNCGSHGGQVVNHLHYHLLGGEPFGAGLV